MMRRHWIIGMVCAFLALGSSAWAAKGRWVETQVWSGSGTIVTEPFLINGPKWRLLYAPRGTGSFEIRVHDSAGNVIETAAETRELVRGTRTFKGDKGLRYLTLKGVDASWEVRLEQYLNVVEEWQLTQWLRGWKPAVEPVAVWVGQSTDAEFELVIPAGNSWKVMVTNESHGRLSATMEAEDGRLPLNAVLESPQQVVGWGYRSGAYKLNIKADNTPWRVEVFGVVFPR